MTFLNNYFRNQKHQNTGNDPQEQKNSDQNNEMTLRVKKKFDILNFQSQTCGKTSGIKTFRYHIKKTFQNNDPCGYSPLNDGP